MNLLFTEKRYKLIFPGVKSFFFTLFAFCLSIMVYGQTEQILRDKTKSDRDITDYKLGVKASTWMDRAKTYQGIASSGNVKIDSTAATTAYDAYKKVIELDKNKNGDPGRLAKEAEEALKSPGLYSAFMQQGVAKFQSKNYRDAIKAMSIAGDINPRIR